MYLDWELMMQTDLWLLPHGGVELDASSEAAACSASPGQACAGPTVEGWADDRNGTVSAPAMRVLDADGRAWVGFAAGRGDLGLEQYEISEWWFRRNVEGLRNMSGA